MSTTVKSAKRVMEVLEFFAECKKNLSAHDVVNALGYPQSSTSNLLHSLVSLGYLTFDARSRTFRPTIRIAVLGAWMLDNFSQTASPFTLMEKLLEATGDTILLGTQNGTQVLYLRVLQATNPIRFYMKPGSLRPLCFTAVGQALLSLQSDDEIGLLVRRINAEQTENLPPIKASALIKEIEHGRERGYFATWGTATKGAGVIAVPLPPVPDHPPLALGIGAPIDRLDEKIDEYYGLMKPEVARLKL